MRQLHPARPLRQSPAHPHPVFIKKEEIHVVPTSLTLCKITHLQQLLYSPLLNKISFIFFFSFIPHRAQHLPQLLWPGKVYSNQSRQRLGCSHSQATGGKEEQGLEDDWSRTGTNLLWEEHDVITLVHEKLHRCLGVVLLSPFSGGGRL
jgi:hypothetical protein